MALNDAALTTGSTAIEAEITHMQLHSGARGADGTSNVIAGSRIAVNGAVDADGDITWTNLNWTGLPANQPVAEVSYWTGTAGAYRGGGTATGDTSANSAGEFSVTSITETVTSS